MEELEEHTGTRLARSNVVVWKVLRSFTCFRNSYNTVKISCHVNMRKACTVGTETDLTMRCIDMAFVFPSSNATDSPASSDFHSNIYEGDDDLVIDLPE